MFQKISVQRLSTGSVFKLIAIGLIASLVPFSLLMGGLAFFGANTVQWNNENIHGFSALIASPFIGLIVALVFTLFAGPFMALGLWFYSMKKPMTLMMKVSPQIETNEDVELDSAEHGRSKAW